jgi:pimeloyl-ACP methyl ester carboxylesterase
VLSIGGKKDLVARPEQAHAAFDGWAVAGHTAVDLDTGHWVMYEDPDGFNSILIEFIES